MRKVLNGKVAARTINIVENNRHSFPQTFDEISAAGEKTHSKKMRIYSPKSLGWSQHRGPGA
jgi:hypothetical protein